MLHSCRPTSWLTFILLHDAAVVQRQALMCEIRLVMTSEAHTDALVSLQSLTESKGGCKHCVSYRRLEWEVAGQGQTRLPQLPYSRYPRAGVQVLKGRY